MYAHVPSKHPEYISLQNLLIQIHLELFFLSSLQVDEHQLVPIRIYMYIHMKGGTYMYKLIHALVYLSVIVYIHMCCYMYMYMYVHVCIHVCTCTYTCMYMYMYVCKIYVQLYMFVDVWVHICIYMYDCMYKYMYIIYFFNSFTFGSLALFRNMGTASLPEFTGIFSCISMVSSARK